MGVAASVTLFVLVHRWEQTNLRSEFESWARAQANAVETTLTSYVGALRFMGDFFDNSSGVARQQFAALVQSILPRYPGIQAFSWNPLVQAFVCRSTTCRPTKKTVFSTTAPQPDPRQQTSPSRRRKINKASCGVKRLIFCRAMLRPSEVYYQSRKMWQAWMVLGGSLLLTILVACDMLRKVLHTAEIEERVVTQAQTNQRLEKEISERIAAEAQRDEAILNLQQALKEVKTLRGILPICSYCKKVRDDKGYWEHVDVYIHKHSQADISHGICPDCQKEYFPEYHARKHPPDNE